jgi:hypothetical protein
MTFNPIVDTIYAAELLARVSEQVLVGRDS